MRFLLEAPFGVRVAVGLLPEAQLPSEVQPRVEGPRRLARPILLFRVSRTVRLHHGIGLDYRSPSI
jgi:hypothetical protein